METGLALIQEYPLNHYSLVHYKTDTPTYIQCPLKIEKSGCLFTLDFYGPTLLVRIDRKVIVDAILVILVNCFAEGKNADGGEILDLVGKDIWTRYSLKHPDKLIENNATPLGDTQLNETHIGLVHLNSSLSMSGDNNPSFKVPSK